jgi:hypothetical protein
MFASFMETMAKPRVQLYLSNLFNGTLPPAGVMYLLLKKVEVSINMESGNVREEATVRPIFYGNIRLHEQD